MQLASPNGAAYRYLGYEQISGPAAATALTIPDGCCVIEMLPYTQAIRWRADGVDPTALVGYPVNANTTYTLAITTPTRVKVIQQAASAVLNVNYFGL